jgi:cold shock CspA family protein
MRGSIMRVSRKDGSDFILAEDGKEVHFDKSGMGGSGVDDLRVGHWVEFELQYGFERLRAVNIKCLNSELDQ